MKMELYTEEEFIEKLSNLCNRNNITLRNEEGLYRDPSQVILDLVAYCFMHSSNKDREKL